MTIACSKMSDRILIKSPTSLAAGSTGRFASIDLWRGLALISIAITHLPQNNLRLATIKENGFSDAAAWFFLLSGYVCHYAYTKRLAEGGWTVMGRAMLKRMLLLYAAQVFIALLYWCLLLTTRHHGLLGSAQWPGAAMSALFINQPLEAVASVLTLQADVMFADMFKAYICILPFFFIVTAIERTLHIPAIVPSVLAYLVNSQWPCPLFSGMSFNPFAWQLIFMIGTYYCRFPQAPVSRGVSGRLVMCAAITMLIACSAIRHAESIFPMPWAYWIHLLEPHGSKDMLYWGYLGHSLLGIYIIANVLKEQHDRGSFAASAICSLGRNTLPVYLISTTICLMAFCLHGLSLSTSLALIYLFLFLLFGIGYCKLKLMFKGRKHPL